VWDVRTGGQIRLIEAHVSPIQGLQFNEDRTLMFTASRDRTVKLWETQQYENLKKYESNRPFNDAAISPLCDPELCEAVMKGRVKDNGDKKVKYHIIAGGGVGGILVLGGVAAYFYFKKKKDELKKLKYKGRKSSEHSRPSQELNDDAFSRSLRRSGSASRMGAAWKSMKNMVNSPPKRGVDAMTTVLHSEGANPMATLDAGVEMTDAGWGQDAAANEAMVRGMHGPKSTKALVPIGGVTLGDDSAAMAGLESVLLQSMVAPMHRGSSDMVAGNSGGRTSTGGGRRGSSDLESPGTGGKVAGPFDGDHPADFLAHLPSRRMPRDKLSGDGGGRSSPVATLGTGGSVDIAQQHTPTRGKVGELSSKPDPSKPGATKAKPKKKLGLMERAKARAAARKAGTESAALHRPKPVERTSSAEERESIEGQEAALDLDGPVEGVGQVVEFMSSPRQKEKERREAEQKAFEAEKAAKREALKQKALAKKKARELAKKQAAEAKESAI